MTMIPPDADILPPSDDYIFKTLLTRPDAERVVADVVSAVTNLNIKSVHIKNNELPITDSKEKGERLDVNCTVIDENGKKRQINVEMQGSSMGEHKDSSLNFRTKYAYYGMDLHTSQPSKGVNYVKLMQTYQITFCNYTVFPDKPDFVHNIALRFPNGELFSDQLIIVVIEMDKLGYALNKRVEELTPIEKWGLFFGHAQDPNYREIINSIIETKKEVGMASEMLMEISQNEAERARFMSRKKFQMDLLSDMQTSKEVGWIEGIEEGEARARLAMAAKMKAKGIDINTIMEVTNLSVDEILKA